MEIRTFFTDLYSEFGSYYDKLIIVLPKILLALIIVFVLSLILKYLRQRIISLMSKRADDQLLANFTDGIVRIVNIILLAFLFLVIIDQGAIAGSLFGAAGLSAFIIGFALKDIIENFLAGVIMAFNRPFRIMDTIEINGISGNIIQMNLRETIIKTFDGKDVYIPNSIILKNPLYNFTIDGFLRREFVVGVDHGSNLSQVIKIIIDELASVPGILSGDKNPEVIIHSLEASTINLKVFFWINTFDDQFSLFTLQNNAVEKVLLKLVEKDIKMPSDIIELKNYTNEFKVRTNNLSL